MYCIDKYRKEPRTGKYRQRAETFGGTYTDPQRACVVEHEPADELLFRISLPCVSEGRGS